MSSMGGNGVKADYPGIPAMSFKPPYDMIPADVGGGCVKEGPFVKYACNSQVTSLMIELTFCQHDSLPWPYWQDP